MNYYRGAVVTDLTEENLREHFEVYAALISLASAKVARQRDPEVVRRLSAVFAEFVATSARDIEERSRLGWSFRSIVHHAGAGPRLLAMLRNGKGFLRMISHWRSRPPSRRSSRRSAPSSRRSPPGMLKRPRPRRAG